MLKLEETIISHANQAVREIESFVGRTKFSLSDIADLLTAFRNCSALVMLSLDRDSGMSQDAIDALNVVEDRCARAFSSIDTHQDKTEPFAAASEAIKFSFEIIEGKKFLKYWLDGEFDAIRKEWPNAPESVYTGVDYFHVKGNV